MPTVTKAQIDRSIDEAKARTKICDALRGLTPVQKIDVLARELAEHTNRMLRYEETEL